MVRVRAVTGTRRRNRYLLMTHCDLLKDLSGLEFDLSKDWGADIL